MLKYLPALGTQAGWNRYTFLSDKFESLHDILPFIKVGARQHFVQYNPNGPDVALLGVFVASVCLRRHIPRRPHIVKHFGFLPHLFDCAIAKIDYLGYEVFGGQARDLLEENVLWFEVSVYDAMFLQNPVPLKEFLQNKQSLGWFDLAAFGDVLFQCAPFQ